jgi:transcription termination/antitermination protein NusG
MKRWYVVQVYAGYEQAAKVDIERRIQSEQMQDYFGDILVPAAKSKPMFATDDSADQQLFPGYILVEMEMTPESLRVVTASMRVLRFLGGKNPEPISQKEIDRIISQIKGEIVVEAEREEFTLGSEVDIIEGPFSGFVGIIDSVDYNNEKLTVMVSIFGRMTPVELSFHQIKR